MENICIVCKIGKTRNHKDRPNLYCSPKCYASTIKGKPIIHLKNVQFKKGHLAWNNGGILKYCLICAKQRKVSPSIEKKGFGNYCSRNCAVEGFKGNLPWNKGLKGFLAGSKHANWKGGITTANTVIRRSAEYKSWVLSVFKRDNFTCKLCNRKDEVSGRLNADHIKPFSLYPELRFDLNNGQTLCLDCHKEKTISDWNLIRERRVNEWYILGR